MDVTGWDSVVFTVTPPREVFARVLASVLARWPAALVDGFEEGHPGPEPVAGLPLERLPAGDGYLQFYRDGAMMRHAEEVAYAPMADGDGLFGVITRERREVVFALSGLDELRAADSPPGGVRPPHPYPAWLCSPRIIEVTAVTPGDPEVQPFAAWVLGEVKRACLGPA